MFEIYNFWQVNDFYHPSSYVANSCRFQIEVQKLKFLREFCCYDYEILQDDA
jgi:hypothetical protein